MVKPILQLIVAASLLFSTLVSADTDALKQKIESTLGMQVTAIKAAPVAGLLQVTTDKGLFYVSEDGRYFMQARIFDLQQGMKNITETAMAEMRLDGLSDFADDAIVFKANNEKHTISVFTDITCGYCRKMHKEIDQLNALGITVRYFAFPRNGLSSPTYQDMVSVWCASNPQQALTSAKQGDDVAQKQCSNTVAQQFEFGQSIGVNGTPNIILEDGTLIPGYQPAGVLAQILDQQG